MLVLNFTYNLVSLIDTLGVAQGIILGTLLLAINREKIQSTVYLGLFILTFSLDTIPDILNDLNITKQHPDLFLLPFDFIWLLFALFYLYVQKIVSEKTKLKFWVLYPGLFHFLFQIIVFFLPFSIKKQIDDSVSYNLFMLAGFIYAIWMCVLCVRWINQHTKESKNSFSVADYKELRWAKSYALVVIILIISIFICFPFLDYSSGDLFFSSVGVGILYWVSIHGIFQLSRRSVLFSTDQNRSYFCKIITKENDSSSEEAIQDFACQLNQFILDSGIYKKSKLTIVDVAEGMNVHPRKISMVINKVYGQNFNTFINQYRVKKAQEMLTTEAAQNLSIEGIGTEVGFQSKSSFYTAFKRATGVTPGNYKVEPI